MFFLTETEFDKEYFKRSIAETADEINRMPLKDRLKFISSVESEVIDRLNWEKVQARIKYDTITDILDKYNNR